MVKWIPNIQGIDPSHQLCVSFYEKMKEYDMFLLCHCGDEKALINCNFQVFFKIHHVLAFFYLLFVLSLIAKF